MCKGSPPMYLHIWVCMRRGVYAASSSATSWWCYGGSSHVWETHSAFLVSFRDNLSHGSSSSPPSQIHRECVWERSHWHSTGGFRDTNGRSKTTQVVFFGTHWRHPGNWMDTNPVCECSETLLYTRLPSHISSQVFLGSVWAPHMHCVAAPIFHWWYMCDLFPFSSSLAAPWSQMSQDEESFKSCLSILEEVSAAEKASLCEICQREYQDYHSTSEKSEHKH